MAEFYMNMNNGFAKSELSFRLGEMLKEIPIVVCIGTDAVIGDSLGPLVGSLLKKKTNGKTYVFGSMENPVTALDVEHFTRGIKKIYPTAKILAVDAALGGKGEIGAVKISDSPIKPGLGVNKNLGEIGDVSIIGIVDEKRDGKSRLSGVRLSLVYFQAELIASAIADCIEKTAYAERK